MKPVTLLVVCLLAACGGQSGSDGDGGLVPCSQITSTSACSQRSDCAADVCFACTCTPSHESCRGKNEPPYECPALGCPQPLCCGAAGDCPNGATCTAPGAMPCGGACNDTPGDCTSDGDCDPAGTGRICEPIACACQPASHCVAGCSAANACATGTSCDPTSRRCLADSCAGGCPDNFECGDLGRCVRARCQGDAECVGGFCVEGACYDGRGECRFPVP